MPRYYIDTDDGDFKHQDLEGYDLPTVHDARQAAIDALPDMARHKRTRPVKALSAPRALF